MAQELHRNYHSLGQELPELSLFLGTKKRPEP